MMLVSHSYSHLAAERREILMNLIGRCCITLSMINASQYTRLKHNSEKINCLSFSLILIHSEQSLKYSRNNLEWESKDWPIITKTHPAFFKVINGLKSNLNIN